MVGWLDVAGCSRVGVRGVVSGVEVFQMGTVMVLILMIRKEIKF